MDPSLRQFLESGSTLITNTMIPKSQPVKVSKKVVMEKIEVKEWDKALIARCKDEKVPKKDLVLEFKKIIEREEELI
jgi:hypothetical protein